MSLADCQQMIESEVDKYREGINGAVEEAEDVVGEELEEVKVAQPQVQAKPKKIQPPQK